MSDSVQPPEGLPSEQLFTTLDVDEAVRALAANCYLGEEGPLERADLEEISRVVLTSFVAGRNRRAYFPGRA